MTDGAPRPDHGEGWLERVCADCAASWVGHVTDGPTWCPFCERRLELAVELQRRELLSPPNLSSDRGNPRYDELDDVDRVIWDRTRGQVRGSDSLLWWVARLRRAVDAGLITRAEADQALRKAAE